MVYYLFDFGRFIIFLYLGNKYKCFSFLEYVNSLLWLRNNKITKVEGVFFIKKLELWTIAIIIAYNLARKLLKGYCPENDYFSNKRKHRNRPCEQ